MTIDALDAAMEKVKIIYNRTVDATTELSINVVRAWTSWYEVQ
jgi:hypothetical protein